MTMQCLAKKLASILFSDKNLIVSEITYYDSNIVQISERVSCKSRFVQVAMYWLLRSTSMGEIFVQHWTS